MKKQNSILSGLFAPRLLEKAMHSFDKATMVVVLSSWGGALVLVAIALYTLNLSLETTRHRIEAMAMEPLLPEIVNQAPDSNEMKPIVDRLKNQFGELKFEESTGQGLAVIAIDGAQFRTWLAALSYIDTVSPQYRWQIKELCVGSACPGALMRALLSPQKITFMLPNHK